MKKSKSISVSAGFFEIGIWTFLPLFILYLIISSILIPTSGWTSLLVAVNRAIFVGISFIIIVLISWAKKHAGKKKFLIKKILLFPLLLSQILFYVVVPGDCWDIPCFTGATAIERFLGTRFFSPTLAYDLFIILFFVYVFFFILFLVDLTRNAK